jgi:predicted Zn-dependent protease
MFISFFRFKLMPFNLKIQSRWVSTLKRRHIRAALRMALACLILALSPLQARDGVEVGDTSAFAKLVPAYGKGVLKSSEQPQVIRLREIAKKLIEQSSMWNDRAKQWSWEVNLIESPQVNAFCMPGGKIAVYTGLVYKLGLSEDELAMVVGHEIAHALREHARQRMGKGMATEGVTRLGGAVIAGIFGLDPRITDYVAKQGAGLLSLKFSREDETDADLVGMELAARAGFDPRAGISLWKKMSVQNAQTPPQWLSTHPSSNNRVKDIEANLNKVMPLFEKAQHLERLEKYNIEPKN